MQHILVPIFICVVLPVAVVLITGIIRMNTVRQRTQVLLKAIEVNKNADVERLAESMRPPRKTPEELLSLRLLRGCIFSLTGLVLICVGLILAVSFDIEATVWTIITGAILIAIGASYLIVYRMTRKCTETTATTTSAEKL
ncbi:MAG: hypothetical protein HDS13_08100 [Bacteroides sp.]|nr:hypothetical protein [Bacteroides sp.]